MDGFMETIGKLVQKPLKNYDTRINLMKIQNGVAKLPLDQDAIFVSDRDDYKIYIVIKKYRKEGAFDTLVDFSITLQHFVDNSRRDVVVGAVVSGIGIVIYLSTQWQLAAFSMMTIAVGWWTTGAMRQEDAHKEASRLKAMVKESLRDDIAYKIYRY